MTEKPPWRQALEQYERAIGAPLEEYVKSDEFADRAAEAARSHAQFQREMSSETRLRSCRSDQSASRSIRRPAGWPANFSRLAAESVSTRSDTKFTSANTRSPSVMK